MMGIRILETVMMVEVVEDWSRVRSPGRARRRLRLGHKQNIETRQVPRRDVITVGGVMYAHPATVQALRASMSAAIDRRLNRALYAGAQH